MAICKTSWGGATAAGKSRFASRLQIAATIFLFLPVTACDNPFDYDNFRAHAVADFIADGQPYHREWDFNIHRRRTYDIESGPGNDWSVDQAGLLLPAPDGRGFLVAGATFLVAMKGVMDFNVPLVIADNAVTPRSFRFPTAPCNNFPASECSVQIHLELKKGEHIFTRDRRPYFLDVSGGIKVEASGKLLDDVEKGFRFVSARSFWCPAERWHKASISTADIAMLESTTLTGRPVVIGGERVAGGNDHQDLSSSTELEKSCFGDGLLWARRDDEYGRWLEYRGNGLWGFPAVSSSEVVFRIPTLTHPDSLSQIDSPQDFWDYVREMALPSGQSVRFDNPGHPFQYLMVDKTTGSLILVESGNASYLRNLSARFVRFMPADMIRLDDGAAD